MSKRVSNPAQWTEAVIKDFTATAPENSLGLPTGEKAFSQPLTGFSTGADELYNEYKNHIGSFYLSPLELFLKYFPESQPNNALLRHVVTILKNAGIKAMAPLLSSLWARSDQGPYAPCSNWSERHAAR